MHANLVDKTELHDMGILVCLQAVFTGNQNFPMSDWHYSHHLLTLHWHFLMSSFTSTAAHVGTSMGLGNCEIFLVGFPASSLASLFSLPLNTVAKRIMLNHVRPHPSSVLKPQKAPHVTQRKSKVQQRSTETSMICAPLLHFLSAIISCSSTWLDKESHETRLGWWKNCSHACLGAT